LPPPPPPATIKYSTDVTPIGQVHDPVAVKVCNTVEYKEAVVLYNPALNNCCTSDILKNPEGFTVAIFGVAFGPINPALPLGI
jgi:hypothetical protein